MDIESILRFVDRQMLTDVIRKSLKWNDFHILEWNQYQLGGGMGNPVSVGLFRYSVSLIREQKQVNWSMILKVIQSPGNVGMINMGEGDDPSHWNYWKRELLVYQSDILSFLPDGIRAPQCYGVIGIPGDIGFLWLEDISDDFGVAWTLERYARTAYHLGRLNGIRPIENKPPMYSWFSRRRNHQWVDLMPNWKEVNWDHPLMRNRYPPASENMFRQMLMESGKFMSELDRIPETLNHGDTFPTNFMSMRDEKGNHQTIALDWALMGLEPIGDDLSQFVFGVMERLSDTDRNEILEKLFDAYLHGLQESGLIINPLLVRFGFCVTAALRVGLFQIYLINESIKLNNSFYSENATSEIKPECYEVMMAREAYKLFDELFNQEA